MDRGPIEAFSVHGKPGPMESQPYGEPALWRTGPMESRPYGNPPPPGPAEGPHHRAPRGGSPKHRAPAVPLQGEVSPVFVTRCGCQALALSLSPLCRCHRCRVPPGPAQRYPPPPIVGMVQPEGRGREISALWRRGRERRLCVHHRETPGEPWDAPGEAREAPRELLDTPGELRDTLGEPQDTPGEVHEVLGEPRDAPGQPWDASGELLDTSAELLDT